MDNADGVRLEANSSCSAARIGLCNAVDVISWVDVFCKL